MKKKFEFTEKDYKEVERMAAQGMVQDDIARYLGMHPSTLYEKKQFLPRIDEAIKRGRAQGHNFVTGKLYQKIKSGNLTAIIFYLKTQCKWNDTFHLDPGSTKFENLSDDEKLKCINDLPIDVKREAFHRYAAQVKKEMAEAKKASEKPVKKKSKNVPS